MVDLKEKVKSKAPSQAQVQEQADIQADIQTLVDLKEKVKSKASSQAQVQETTDSDTTYSLLKETARLQQVQRELIPGQRNSLFQSNFNKISQILSQMRFGFYNTNFNAGSKIDSQKLYSNITEVLMYLPRATQIGFLAPFPSAWTSDGFTVGKAGRILSGFEMIIWYSLLLSFIWAIYKKPITFIPMFPIFMISIVVILLLAYVIPNIGSIYRMRQTYMIPFYIYGVYGLNLIITSFNKKFK